MFFDTHVGVQPGDSFEKIVFGEEEMPGGAQRDDREARWEDRRTGRRVRCGYIGRPVARAVRTVNGEEVTLRLSGLAEVGPGAKVARQLCVDLVPLSIGRFAADPRLLNVPWLMKP